MSKMNRVQFAQDLVKLYNDNLIVLVVDKYNDVSVLSPAARINHDEYRIMNRAETIAYLIAYAMNQVNNLSCPY